MNKKIKNTKSKKNSRIGTIILIIIVIIFVIIGIFAIKYNFSKAINAKSLSEKILNLYMDSNKW